MPCPLAGGERLIRQRMDVTIVGAGIVGVTTAYELARDGHRVRVYEQRASVAEVSSFGSTGVLAPARLIPWAQPGGAGVRRARGAGLAALTWLWRARRAPRQPAAAQRLEALAQLEHYSLERTRTLALEQLLESETSPGTLVLLRSSDDALRLAPTLALLQRTGTRIRQVDAETARLIEPGLASATPLAGALHTSDGESANCRLFALQLRHKAQQLGVQFFFNTWVRSLQGGGVLLAGESAARSADAVVLCAGTASGALLRPLGPRLPLAALYGYTISAPLRDEMHAPQGCVIDPLHRLVITRQGQRVRVSAGAELGGAAHQRTTLQTMYLALSGWFPGGVLTSSPQVQVWRGARPTLPDGAPVIGARGVARVWLNTGHGACGWAQACGSARALADLIAGRAPAVDLAPFAAARFA